MAGTTTNYSLPYPESTDLVASYPALGQDLAEDLDTILAAKWTFVRQATAPTGAYGVIWEDTSTTPSGMKIWDGSAWSSFSGAPILTAGDVSATTGSPTITTPTIGGIDYTVYDFLASGSITFDRVGLFDVFLGGAGSGGDNGGYANMGGGGMVIDGTFYLPATGAYTITVGAGVACSNNVWQTLGNPSKLGSMLDTRYAAKEVGAGGLPTSSTDRNLPYSVDITGTSFDFGAAAVVSPAANTGQGSYSYFGNTSGSGRVIVRVRT